MKKKTMLLFQSEKTRAVLIDYGNQRKTGEGDEKKTARRCIVIESMDRDALNGERWSLVVEYCDVGDDAEMATFEMLLALGDTTETRQAIEELPRRHSLGDEPIAWTPPSKV